MICRVALPPPRISNPQSSGRMTRNGNRRVAGAAHSATPSPRTGSDDERRPWRKVDRVRIGAEHVGPRPEGVALPVAVDVAESFEENEAGFFGS